MFASSGGMMEFFHLENTKIVLLDGRLERFDFV